MRDLRFTRLQSAAAALLAAGPAGQPVRRHTACPTEQRSRNQAIRTLPRGRGSEGPFGRSGNNTEERSRGQITRDSRYRSFTVAARKVHL